MTKRQAPELAPVGSPHSGLPARADSALLLFSESHEQLATAMGMVTTMGAADLVRAAAAGLGAAEKLKIGSGLALLKARAQCEAGQWTAYLAEVSIPKERAAELMAVADLIAKSEPADRERLLGQPKTVLIGMARLDDAVRQEVLAQGRLNQRLSIAEYEDAVAQAQRQAVDIKAQLDAVTAERDGLAKKLRRRERDAEDHDGTPIAIADLRAEGAALVKKAELALGALYPLGVELSALTGGETVHDFIKPSMRLLLSGVVALRVQADGLIKQFAEALGDDAKKLASPPEGLAFLDDTEIKTVAEDWGRLVAVHQLEAVKRENERENAKPGKRGAKRKVVS